MAKICKYKDKKWLHHEYVILKKSTNEIGKICNMSGGAIMYWLRKHNISIRTISESLIDRVLSEEHKTNLGELWTPERRAKQSKIMTGENSPTKRLEVRTKMSKSHKGKIQSKETRYKISEAMAGRNNPMHNKSHSEETKIKQSVSATELWKDPKFRSNHSGENHYNWQNGKSFEPYGLDFNEVLKEKIKNRDTYTCQICGKTQKELGRKLDIHHIDYDKTNNNPENLISLCKSCHIKTNYNREDWTEYFKKIMEKD